ncbi:MAG: nuclear receptor NHR-99 [Gammaproteobacteria bacterium]|nr:nuclear receptor NHR-99 [Gammaproteobacteria bacterium]MDH5651096.1 nuclear receptor NHR-99 [Gammaproteobacteria bacterium]
MQKHTAYNIMEQMLLLSEHVDKAGALAEQIDDNDERYAIRKGIAEIAGVVYTEIMIPIIRQYPELDPDKK